MNGVYIPISEFARLVGVSVQSVRTKKGADEYTRDTKPKTIDIAAAALYGCEINVDSDGNMSVSRDGNVVNNSVGNDACKANAENSDKTNAEYDILCNTVNEVIATLQRELAAKNEMIEALQASIAEKDAAYRNVTQQLSEMAQREQEISRRAIEALQQRNYIEEHRNVIESEKQAANTAPNTESVTLSVGNAEESVGDNVANRKGKWSFLSMFKRNR